MPDTPQRPLERKLLTICGKRGRNATDSDDYSSSSIERGYAGLNGRIHRLQLDNPGLIIHSASHDCVELKPWPSGLFLCSVTIVYSGQIVDMRGALVDSAPRPPRASDDLEDSEAGYGTVYLVHL
jgi:hypothetical protein